MGKEIWVLNLRNHIYEKEAKYQQANTKAELFDNFSLAKKDLRKKLLIMKLHLMDVLFNMG